MVVMVMVMTTKEMEIMGEMMEMMMILDTMESKAPKFEVQQGHWLTGWAGARADRTGEQLRSSLLSQLYEKGSSSFVPVINLIHLSEVPDEK
eukprot:762052-Hanusia_phi.AAC.2